MDCQISRSDDVALVVIIGSLDSSWSSYLSERFDEVVRSGAHEVLRRHVGRLLLELQRNRALDSLPSPDARRLAGDSGSWPISEAVGHVLKLTGVLNLLMDAGPPLMTGRAWRPPA